MGQAGVDLPDPLGIRPLPGRHGPVAGAGAPAASADPASADDAGADDLLSQLAGEEIDRLLAAAEVDSESSAAQPAAAPPPTVASRTPPSTSAGNRPYAATRATSAPLSPGAHHVIVPPADESDLSVQAELDDAFEQLAGDPGEPIDALPPLEYAPQIAEQGASLPREPDGLHGDGTFMPSHEEPLGELLEQLTAARAEVAEEVRAAAAAEARSGSGTSGGDTEAEDEDELWAPLAPLADDDEPLNLVMPRSAAGDANPALLSDDSPEAPLEVGDWGQPTSADERAGLDLGEIAPDRGAREPLPVRPAIPIPQDEDSFLAAEPAPADGSDRTPLPVRVLEWVNKPLAGLPEAVRQAMGKVAILTLINAVLVLLYVLLVRSR